MNYVCHIDQLKNFMKMKKMILAVMALVALAACKSSVKEQAEVIFA